jgi:hypothetical protein
MNWSKKFCRESSKNGRKGDIPPPGMKVQGKDSLLKKTLFELDKRISSKGSYEFTEEADDELELKAVDKFTCRFEKNYLAPSVPSVSR